MDIEELTKQHNDFGLIILNQVLQMKGEENSNVVFSPLSIYMMISLIASGKAKGKSLDHLLSSLKFNSVDQLNSFVTKIVDVIFNDESDSGGPCVTSASGVWIQDYLPVKPSFRTVLETVYKGKLNQVDFIKKADKVVEKANSWVKKETRGLIKQLIERSSVDELTRLILANALYFKASWESPFKAKATEKFKFHLFNGTSIRVPFMCSWEDRAISVFDGFKVASLPYKRGKRENKKRNRNENENENGNLRDFSMSFYLPDARDGLPSLIERVCSEQGFLDRYRPKSRVKVGKFRIPKVKFSYAFKATEILKEIGLDSVFSKGDLSEMVEFPGEKELLVSEMFHKAVIDINEEYTEAAAVTGLMLCGSCLKREKVVKIDFVADHPFLFVITENKTGTVLFIGQVLDPSSS